MFTTGLNTVARGFTARETLGKYAPDGKFIGDITLGVGDGSIKYPTMWVNVPVWELLGQKAVEIIDKKGIGIEANGMLQVRLYEGKHGKAVAIELKNVRELKIYDRNGELLKVLPDKSEKEIKKEVSDN